MSDPLRELTARLIAIDTVSHRSNVPAAELLAGELEACGFRVTLQSYLDSAGVRKANVVAAIGPAAPDGLIISGHMDTVPWEIQPGWRTDPLRLVLEDDRYVGRGIADMKGFLAECVIAAASVDVRRLRRPLLFLFTADEEVGCLGAGKLAAELAQLVNDMPLPRLAWIGEPTSFVIHHAHKSAVLFRIRVQGRGGHSGLPDGGVSAITIAARIVTAISDLAEDLRHETSDDLRQMFPACPFPTVNVGTVHGGTAANVIAGECELRVLYRSMPGREPLEIYEAISRLISGIDTAERPSGAHRATIEVGEATVVPPMLAPRGTSLEHALRELASVGEPSGSLLAADGCRFSPLGISTLICGPGEFDQAHQANESMPARSLVAGKELVERVIQRMCGDLRQETS